MKTIIIMSSALLLTSCNSSAPITKALNGATTNGTIPDAIWSGTPVSDTFIYRTNSGLNSISIGSIDLDDGKIIEHYNVSTGSASAPSALVMGASNEHMYVANHGSGTIAHYSVNQAIGQITYSSSIPTYPGPSKMVLHPNGKFLFTLHANNSQLSTHAIDPQSGTLSFKSAVSVSGPGAKALAIDRTGTVIFANSDSYIRSYVVDSVTGSLTYSNKQTPMTYSAIVMHPYLNKFYAPVSMNGYIWGFSFDAGTADWNSISTTTGELSFPYTSIQFENNGDYAFITNGHGNTFESYRLNRSTYYLDHVNSTGLPSGCRASSINIVEDKYAFVSCSDSSGRTLTFELNSDGSIEGQVHSTAIAGALISHAIVVEF